MALAHADAVARGVDRHQRHQDEVGRDDRGIVLRLEYPPRPGIDRVPTRKVIARIAVDEKGKGNGQAARGGSPIAGSGLISSFIG